VAGGCLPRGLKSSFVDEIDFFEIFRLLICRAKSGGGRGGGEFVFHYGPVRLMKKSISREFIVRCIRESCFSVFV
jgi:hypothetical protein